MGEKGALLRTFVLAAGLVFAALGCSDDRFTEADLPPEADLAYPGAIELDRNFDEGESGTYIDGGSADRAPRLNVTYHLEGVSNEELIDWYATQLADRGWTVDRRSTTQLSTGLDPSSDPYFRFGVTARADTSSEYDVVVVVARDD